MTAASAADVAASACAWTLTTPEERDYHDREWGVPLHEDRALFELLCLEGAQAGLSWRTVLAKRPHYRRVFGDFRIDHCATLSDDALKTIAADPGVIRHRGKIAAVRGNARAAQSVIEEHGNLAAFLWSFVGGRPVDGQRHTRADVPASTPASLAMSQALRRRGFAFVGPTICYAFMQAAGMVNDHLVGCFRHRQIAGEVHARHPCR